MSDKNKRIASLQGLRVLAFCGVFMSHSGGGIPLGGWGVSCFLVMSGFLMYYNYSERQLETSAKKNMAFAIKRIKPLYFLHVAMFVVALLFEERRVDSLRHIVIFIFKMICNLLLVQSWFPKVEFYFSFNAVAWYLSTSMFLYFMFPYLLRGLQRIDSTKKAALRLVLTVSAQVAFSLLLLPFAEQIHRIPVQISDNQIKYLTYICPLYRLGDFYVGCLLGVLFKCGAFHKILNKTAVSTVIEAVCIAAAPMLLYIYQHKIGLLGTESFNTSLIYLADTALLVYTVANGKGLISRWLLSSGWMVAIGNVSGYAYLIHFETLRIISKLFGTMTGWYVRSISGFIFTLAVSYAVKYMMRRFAEKNGNNKGKDSAEPA